MAFYQPTFAPPRQNSPRQEYNLPVPPPTNQQRQIRESQEWILFPAQTDSSTQTQTASTARTPGTAGLSRLSDFGSLDTAARSGRHDDDEGAIDDDELDSLDDGLHAFHAPSSMYQEPRHCDQSDSILPTHDGLGTFPVSNPPFQDQIWHFEQYNPRKRSLDGHHRRRSSVQRRLDAVEENEEANMETERVERIQKWRLEQSRALLDEVEKQTRRRMSHSSQRLSTAANRLTDEPAEKTIDERSATIEAPCDSPKASNLPLIGNDSFWQRVTRRVIRDFIGIDDALLSVILGEALPVENPRPSVSLSASKSVPDLSSVTTYSTGWEARLLDRLGRELGIVVQQLSDHPGAFTAHSPRSIPDYAGMPIPSTPAAQPSTSDTASQDPVTASTTTPHFTPTLANHRPPSSRSDTYHASLWGIEEEPSPTPAQTQRQAELDYWQQPPTLKTIFRFLHQRFTSSRPAPPRPTNIATSVTSESLRRAAVIRAHHPLVSRAHHHARRSAFPYGARRAESSCASVSSRCRRSGSSRNYWELAGSTAGSGSLVGGAGGYGLGGWGEV